MFGDSAGGGAPVTLVGFDDVTASPGLPLPAGTVGALVGALGTGASFKVTVGETVGDKRRFSPLELCTFDEDLFALLFLTTKIEVIRIASASSKKTNREPFLFMMVVLIKNFYDIFL